MNALCLCLFHSNSLLRHKHIKYILYNKMYTHTILDIITCSYLHFVGSSQEPKASLQSG